MEVPAHHTNAACSGIDCFFTTVPSKICQVSLMVKPYKARWIWCQTLSEIESFTNPLSRHILIFSGKAELSLWISWQLSVRLKFIPSTWWENHRQESSFTWILTQPLLQNSVNSKCMSTPILCLVTWLPQEGIIESIYVGTKRIKDHLWFTKKISSKHFRGISNASFFCEANPM